MTNNQKGAHAAPRAKSPPAPPYPLAPETETYIAALREQLSKSGLGHLGRRIEMAARDAQETADTYGSKVFTGRSIGGQRVTLPVKTTISQHIQIECNGTVVQYDLAVGSSPSAGAPRRETPLDDFPAPT